MNKRKHKRFVITLSAKITVGNESYDGVIGNVSGEGISSTLTTYVKTNNKLILHSCIVGLSFELPSGGLIAMDCEVRWFVKPADKKETLILGLYIVDPPSEYTEWISKFQ